MTAFRSSARVWRGLKLGEITIIMDRIMEFGFPLDPHENEITELLWRLLGEGTEVRLDGWSPRLRGKSQPPQVMEEIKANKLAIIYLLVTLCPHPCESCEGWGVKSMIIGGEPTPRWFCTAHYPEDEGRMKLWKIARKYKELGQKAIESTDRSDYLSYTEEYVATGKALRSLYRMIEPNYPETL